jgi:hypothetical protein
MFRFPHRPWLENGGTVNCASGATAADWLHAGTLEFRAA